VTVGTNNDKAGYGLAQAFPANFGALAISAGGAVTVGTNNDKAGYALSQAFPANFASLAISGAGMVTVGTNNDKAGYQVAPNGLDTVVVETGVNARQAMSAVLASAVGVLSGAATNTITIRGGNVATTRIQATVDAQGNRSAVALTLPA
jgi:hypothetical protein